MKFPGKICVMIILKVTNRALRLCIPFRGNSASILFKSSERIGIFKFNFSALI